jgi:hypothetical protein
MLSKGQVSHTQLIATSRLIIQPNK